MALLALLVQSDLLVFKVGWVLLDLLVLLVLQVLRVLLVRLVFEVLMAQWAPLA